MKPGIASGKPPSNPEVGPGQARLWTCRRGKTSVATDWLTDRAIDWMSGDDSGKPFLTLVRYPDPHGPILLVLPTTIALTTCHSSRRAPIKPDSHRRNVAPPKWLGGSNKHPVFRGEQMFAYFGMVQCIDDNVARLIEPLQRSGQLDETLIVMTSVHGDLC